MKTYSVEPQEHTPNLIENRRVISEIKHEWAPPFYYAFITCTLKHRVIAE